MRKPEILYLKQEDVIKAGVLDMKMILEQTEYAYKMLGSGKVINPTKVKLGIPDGENWESFFMSMPSYIADDADIVGFKWAAEAKANINVEDLPWGIDVVMLSDPKTALPLAIMDGTIITAMRTSAVAGMAAKYLVSKNSKIACFVGAGVIGRTMVMAMMEACPYIEQINLVDLNIEKAKAIAEEFKGKYNIVPSTSIEGAAKNADIIVTQTTSVTPIVKRGWLKKNATVIQNTFCDLEMDILLNADRLFSDSWKQMGALKGWNFNALVTEHNIAQEKVTELEELLIGAKPGRQNEDEFLVCGTLGIGVVDIAVAYKLYKNALEKNIGQKLYFWEKPLWI